jgi:hypothetical protein
MESLTRRPEVDSAHYGGNTEEANARMSTARTDVGGRGAASVPGDVEALRSAYAAFNEVARTGGGLPAFVQGYWHPHAKYRPIEEPDEWFSDPEGITRSLARWLETWEIGKYRLEPEQIDELGNERFLVASRHVGVGRGSGVPIDAVTYLAVTWRDGRFLSADEYSDREGALAALEQEGEPAVRPERERAPFAVRAWQLGEAAFTAFVRSRSDRQLERLLGSDPALRAVFKRMERVFEPTKAGGFEGELQWELLGRRDVKKWVARIADGEATSRQGEARAPAVTMRVGLPLFIRIAAGEIHPARAWRLGLLELEGDFSVAARIGVMFGLSR